MSINVTVHGNPISIKRGKMVTYDDSEFERRRQIRLEQVRQQSKQIAADVRNRVRKEKEKQLTRVERQGERELKNWQARKLHNLQKQYQNCINEVGTAHTNAALERDPNEVLVEIANKNQNTADKRGKIAIEKQRSEDKKRHLESTKAVGRKRMIRSVEDTRSSMVSQLKKDGTRKPKHRKKLKTVSTDVTITSNVLTDSESSNVSASDTECICSPCESSEETTVDKRDNYELPDKNVLPEDYSRPGKSKQTDLPASTINLNVNASSKEPCNTSLKLDGLVSGESESSSMDSTSKKQPDKYDLFEKHSQPHYFRTSKISDRIYLRNPKPTDMINPNVGVASPGTSCTGQCLINEPEGSEGMVGADSRPKVVLPYMPTVSLRKDSVIFDERGPEQEQKVKYYDHRNLFNKEKTAPPTVIKISKESVMYHSPHEQEETALFHKTMAQNDKKAQERGVKAIEKVRMEKDYKKLMEELPVLQKQERLASMRTHNPAHHMTEERLQQLEREKQNRIDNLFEELYKKTQQLETPIITIKPVKKTPPDEQAKMPFKVLDLTESPQQLNLADWETEEKSSTDNANKQLAVDTSSDDVLQEKQKTLASLLDRVNKQRELLLKEVSALPASSNLHNILQDEELLEIVHYEKHAQVIEFVSIATSPVHMSPSEEHKENVQQTQPEKSSPTGSIKESARKKQKVEKYNKNVETQTSQPPSPSVTPNKQDVPPVPKEPPKDSKLEAQPKQIIEDGEGNLCEIIIKMKDETNVKISASTLTKKMPKKNKVQETRRKKQKVIILKSKQAKKTEKESQTQRPLINYDLSTSTTYLSPPEARLGIPPVNVLKDVLRPKPQQSNVVIASDHSSDSVAQISLASRKSSKEINPRLVKYIKKLLNMSRQSIDELTVSSVSDVATPGTSVLDTSTNTSLIQLQNVMNHFNLNVADLFECQPCSGAAPDGSKGPPAETYAESRPPPDGKCQLVNTATATETKNSALFTKYSDLAQHATDRIVALTNLIDKVRREKEDLLSPTSDKNDNSETTYLNLPSKFINDLSNESRKIIDPDKSNSSSLNSLDRYLLAIEDDADKGSTNASLDRDGKTECKCIEDKQSNQVEESFVPVLQGIPKHTEHNNEEVDSLKLRLTELLKESKPKPPPSLLWNARRNVHLDMTPHELSTIVEMETVASSRNVSDRAVHRAPSPTAPNNVIIQCSPTCMGAEPANATPPTTSGELKTAQKGILKRAPERPSTSQDEQHEPDDSDIQPFTDKSTSSEDVARILQNLGLNWALPTLKKTQESYAFSSSSSSGDTSLKKYVSFKDTSITGMDSSLKDSLTIQLKNVYAANVHTSTNISASGREDRNKTRTSTPVFPSTGSTPAGQLLLTGESDLSSVNMSEELHLSVPQTTLKTNPSFSKSE